MVLAERDAAAGMCHRAALMQGTEKVKLAEGNLVEGKAAEYQERQVKGKWDTSRQVLSAEELEAGCVKNLTPASNSF